jgi:hypothetical protein
MDQIITGNLVLSPAAIVLRDLFVSKPGHKGRPLYRFKGSTVKFKSTHLILRPFRSDEKHGEAPTLAFIDPGPSLSP